MSESTDWRTIADEATRELDQASERSVEATDQLTAALQELRRQAADRRSR